MWITFVLIGLFIIVLILYLIKRKSKKPESSSTIQRSQLEVLLEKELTPRLKEIEEKEDFRYRQDYNKNLSSAGGREFLKQEYEQVLKDGINKFKAKDYDGAELEFSKVLDSDNTNGAAYYYRGLIKNNREEYANAINDFDLAVAYGFQESVLHFQKGFANLHLKIYNNASDEFEHFLLLNPGDIEGHFNKGLADSGMENYQSAIDEFSKIIELKPNHETAYLERGKAYLMNGDKKSACLDFKEAFKKGCLPAHHYLKTECNEQE